MSLKSGIYKHRRTVWRVVAGVVVLCCLWAVYIRYVSPTRVALVNFPAYQASSIALANESRWVRVDVLTVEEAAKIGRYDVALFFGPGLRLNGDQAADIEAAGAKGTAVYTLIFPSGVIANHHVDSLQQELIGDYYGNGNKTNYKNLLGFCRTALDRRKWFAPAVDRPVHLPSDYYWHLGEENFFTDLNGYKSYCREHGFYKEGAPSVALVSGMTSPLSGNRQM